MIVRNDENESLRYEKGCRQTKDEKQINNIQFYREKHEMREIWFVYSSGILLEETIEMREM